MYNFKKQTVVAQTSVLNTNVIEEGVGIDKNTEAFFSENLHSNYEGTAFRTNRADLPNVNGIVSENNYDVSQKNLDAFPADDASEDEVLNFYRELVRKRNVAPPKVWKQMRFELPSSVPDLHLFPPLQAKVQYTQPITPSPCLVLLLEGQRPEELSVKEYMMQMVDYVIDLLEYNQAVTALTTLLFVKKGTEIDQMVVTFGADIALASSLLSQLQEAGVNAGFGPPVHEYPPNATFQIVDYHKKMNGGKGITKEQIAHLLSPFQNNGAGDIRVIESYENGVFYAAVKRSETVYSFLWNTFCSFHFQRDLYKRYGVLVTMALCPHEFVQRNSAFHTQQQEKYKSNNYYDQDGRVNMEIKERENGAYDDDNKDDDSDSGSSSNENTKVFDDPNWYENAVKSVDIFAGVTNEVPDPALDLDDLWLKDDILDSTPVAKAAAGSQRGKPNGLEQKMPISSIQNNDMWSADQTLGASGLSGQNSSTVYTNSNEGNYPMLLDRDPMENGGVEYNYGNLTQSGPENFAVPYVDSRYFSPETNSVPYNENRSGISWNLSIPQSQTFRTNNGVLDSFPRNRNENSYGSMNYYASQPAPAISNPVLPYIQESILPLSSNDAAAGIVPMSTANTPYNYHSFHTKSPLYFEDLEKVVEMFEERVLYAFPNSKIPSKFQPLSELGSANDNASSSVSMMMDLVKPEVEIPKNRTVEIEELFLFLESEFYRITSLLKSTAQNVKIQQLRDRLARSFFIRDNENISPDDWIWRSVGRCADGHDIPGGNLSSNTDAHGNKKNKNVTEPVLDNEDDRENEQLPALLPYLLACPLGINVLRLLFVLYVNTTTLSMLCRYILPFITDANVVREVVLPALRCAPEESNPLNQLIMKHPVNLSNWLEAFLKNQLKVAAMIANVPKTDHSLISKRDDQTFSGELSKGGVSQVANSIDCLLSGMSRAQKSCAFDFIKKSPFTADDIWNEKNLLKRTMLKLYLISDLLDGGDLVQELFSASSGIDNEQFLFVSTLCLPSLASEFLSCETARFYGSLFRFIEILNESNRETQIGRSEALQLAETCSKAIRSDFVFNVLKKEYLNLPTPAQRFDILATMEKSLQTKCILLAPPLPVLAKESAIKFTKEEAVPILGSNQTSEVQNVSKTKLLKGIGEATTFSFTFWHHQWTATMKEYPPIGEPFESLPSGWSSSVSRSFGYYYFKPPAHSRIEATYKHPSNGNEYLATPQAFLREGRQTDDNHLKNAQMAAVIDLGNRKLAKALFDSDGFEGMYLPSKCITIEDIETWYNNQSLRHYYLDVAVLEVLGVKYRAGGYTKDDHATSKQKSTEPGAQGRDDGRLHGEKFNEVAMKLKSIHKGYPAKGEPFPPLHRGWDSDLKTSTGTYVFSGSEHRAESHFKHPQTKRPFRVSPQEFARKYRLRDSEIASHSKKTIEDVEKWMSDQRNRDTELDATVVQMLHIHYTAFEDLKDVAGNSTRDSIGKGNDQRKRDRKSYDDEGRHGRHYTSHKERDQRGPKRYRR